MTPVVMRIKDRKRELGHLYLDDDGTRIQPLRELNQLQDGDSNKTD